MHIRPAADSTACRQLYLVLRNEDGSAWTLRFSAGVERFIGIYPRLESLDCGAPLLAFREIDPA
ncbi:MAG: hypothetical protein JWO25_3774 [Alphaproteobacteria bacterium]|nr:hypothetical protein [Alphaproteobacteria bacterium]